MVGARDRDLAGLERLAQRIEHLRLEFRQLVEEEHAVMRERDFARPRAQAAADQRRHAGGMMRRAERPAVGERAVLDLARDRGDHRDFEQFGRRQRRQDRRQPRRQHRLAGAGRADHQQVVAAGGGDLERALGALLALDVVEVEPARLRPRGSSGCGRDSTCVPRKWLASWISEAAAMISISGLAQAASGAAGGRADQAFAAGIGADRGRQHAGDRARSSRRGRARPAP